MAQEVRWGRDDVGIVPYAPFSDRNSWGAMTLLRCPKFLRCLTANA